MHGARAALTEPTSKLRAIELELVAKHIQQRRVRRGRNIMLGAVDSNAKSSHKAQTGERLILLNLMTMRSLTLAGNVYNFLGP